MGKPKLHPAVAGLLAFADGKAADGLPGDMWGAAARAAVIVLLNDWQLTMTGCASPPLKSQNLVTDVDWVIAHLQAFRNKAAATLPAEFTGVQESLPPPSTSA